MGEFFKVRYSQADTASLELELIKKYKFKEPVNCRLFKNGLNDVYIITTGQGIYYLRISLAGMYSKIDYEEEVMIMIALNENGVNTAAPVKCAAGGYVWHINAPEGTRYAVLFTEVKNAPAADNLKRNFNFGQAIAKMHVIADEKNFKVSRAPIDFAQLTQQPLKRLQPYLESRRPADYRFLGDAAQKLRGFIEERLTTEKPYYGFCHGDIQLGNVFFCDADIPTFFDFDCMGYGWRAHDLCVHVWNMDDNGAYLQTDEGKKLLEGYNSVLRLSQNELECINAFGALRALWVMGIHMDLTERNTCCMSFNDNYFDWLTGNFKTWYNKIF